MQFIPPIEVGVFLHFLINTYDERKSREFIEQLKTELRKVVQTLVKNNSELKVFAKGWNKRIDNY